MAIATKQARNYAKKRAGKKSPVVSFRLDDRSLREVLDGCAKTKLSISDYIKGELALAKVLEVPVVKDEAL
jgi:hypothetical protein